MAERITQMAAVFRYPARLPGIEGLLPAGTYAVETVEEQISGLSFVAYRHLQTTIEVPLKAAALSGRQVVAIEPQDLQSALDQDASCSTSVQGPLADATWSASHFANSSATGQNE